MYVSSVFTEETVLKISKHAAQRSPSSYRQIDSFEVSIVERRPRVLHVATMVVAAATLMCGKRSRQPAGICTTAPSCVRCSRHGGCVPQCGCVITHHRALSSTQSFAFFFSSFPSFLSLIRHLVRECSALVSGHSPFRSLVAIDISFRVGAGHEYSCCNCRSTIKNLEERGELEINARTHRRNM